MIAEQGFTETRRDKTMSGMRYVVAVTDTAASWNAFQVHDVEKACVWLLILL